MVFERGEVVNTCNDLSMAADLGVRKREAEACSGSSPGYPAPLVPGH
jgi:hypothetical protein